MGTVNGLYIVHSKVPGCRFHPYDPTALDRSWTDLAVAVANLLRYRYGAKNITGWWYTYLSEKYEFVSWDSEIPNMWKNKNK